MKLILEKQFNSNIDVFIFKKHSVYRVPVTEITDTSIVAFHIHDQVGNKENLAFFKVKVITSTYSPKYYNNLKTYSI